ncbi:hypothetical protein EZV62_007344 [Acer yangbiense]|uniref:DC1 domain-containing protein n=1 Tax=Acer yangbiense TaxID=1000413 RepID=A0A5C7IBE3_9ROSI|nr:hypothetical protein EZV62_007344 [Acer yangbiense]
MEIQHFSHPRHKLKLVDSIEEGEEVPNCDCCDEEMSFPGYACEYFPKTRFLTYFDECSFYLHKSCADLAEKISHPLHPHPLILLSEIPGSCTDNFNGIICDGCRDLYCEGFTYYCTWSCGFNLHPKCASKQDHEELLQQQTFNKELSSLYLFCHKHALNFCNLRDSYYIGNPRHHAYCCKECIYIAHIECIISEDNTPPEIPSNMNITELQAEQSMSKKNGATTSLDSKCKDNEQLFSHPSHPHMLTLLKLKSSKKIKYCRCNGCNEVMYFPGYACQESATCKFYLHKSCAELQPNIQHPLHHHSLILDYKIPGSSIDGIICDGCRNLYSECFSYYCSRSCGFNLEAKCASKVQDHEEIQQQQTFNKELTLYHFCHNHALNFCYLRESYSKHCCCCKKIIRGSAYCCLECGFFIHESCKEIPKQVQHPFHPQHLLLAMEVKEVRLCKACRLVIRDIKIGCIECSFNLHVSCANPNYRALKHKCHKHNMYYFLDDDRKGSFECKKCHEKCLKESFYRCVQCNFNLHLKCIPIPSVVTVTQKHHHPLTLIDSIKEDNPLIQYLMDSNDKVDHSMDYYCDVCETPGNPKHHAYCCKECIYIAHVECIISKECPPLEILQYLDTRRESESYVGAFFDSCIITGLLIDNCESATVLVSDTGIGKSWMAREISECGAISEGLCAMEIRWREICRHDEDERLLVTETSPEMERFFSDVADVKFGSKSGEFSGLFPNFRSLHEWASAILEFQESHRFASELLSAN